jgi:hypothetical protein
MADTFEHYELQDCVNRAESAPERARPHQCHWRATWLAPASSRSETSLAMWCSTRLIPHAMQSHARPSTGPALARSPAPASVLGWHSSHDRGQLVAVRVAVKQSELTSSRRQRAGPLPYRALLTTSQAAAKAASGVVDPRRQRWKEHSIYGRWCCRDRGSPRAVPFLVARAMAGCTERASLTVSVSTTSPPLQDSAAALVKESLTVQCKFS